MSEVILKVEGLHKKFTKSLKRSMYYGSVDAMRGMLGLPIHEELRNSEFWALQDINFEIKRGEKIGFLGDNGSGKSTLLRLLNGIYPPDKGRISINGRIGALIAVGAGFHSHMTGRENIYLNGTILGMSKSKIMQKLDEIIDFAEIGDFIDSPVATYSSGMTVRLGFSIAIHGHVDLLLVDEILAVGDLAFQLKCMRKLSEFRLQGGTFIMVSHNMQVIRNSCEKAFWLDKGKLLMSGSIYDICDKYETNQILKSESLVSKDEESLKKINLDSKVKISKVEFYNKQGSITNIFNIGDFIRVRIFYEIKRKIIKPMFAFGIIDREGKVIIECYSDQSEINISEIDANGYIDLDIETLNIKADKYECSVILSEIEQFNKLEWHERAYQIIVTKNQYPINQGLIYPFPIWKLQTEIK